MPSTEQIPTPLLFVLTHPIFTTHALDITSFTCYISVPRQVRPGGCEVHIGKGRVHNQIIALDSAPSLGRTSDIHESRAVHLKLVLTFSMHAFVVGHPPTSTSHPMSRDPRPSPFFATLPLPYIVLNANQKKTTNNAEAWERSYIYL